MTPARRIVTAISVNKEAKIRKGFLLLPIMRLNTPTVSMVDIVNIIIIKVYSAACFGSSFRKSPMNLGPIVACMLKYIEKFIIPEIRTGYIRLLTITCPVLLKRECPCGTKNRKGSRRIRKPGQIYVSCENVP
ncbi:MAG: hypothetical protein EOM23_12095 [Candidatus Moranbacteria bacterium]|nr:hypothetical protein [Candidatus Moranbacteria bacterium]